MRRRFSALAAALVLALASHPALAEEPGARRLRLFLSGNLGGEIAEPNCRREPILAAADDSYARLVARWEREVDGDEPVALFSGDAVFPGPLSRYLLSRGDEGASKLAAILARIPWGAFALGNQELGPPRSETLAFARAARGAGLALQAANLRCAAGARALCEAISDRPWAVVERAGLRIGVVSVLDPQATARLAKSHLEGLTLEPPRDVLPELVFRMRSADRLDLVVVQLHTAQESLGPARELAATVPGIDLMLTNEPVGALTGADVPAGWAVAPGTGTLVVPAGTGPGAAVLLEVEVLRKGPRWRVGSASAHSVSVRPEPPDAETQELLRAAAADYCRDWGSPLGQATLATPMSLPEFRTFVLNVQRQEARAEIAVSNLQAFRPQERFPLTGAMTRADVFATLPYDNRLVTAELPGAALQALAGRLSSDAVAVGLEKGKDGSVTVNGRPLSASRTYRIATSSYLAEGGDGLLDPGKLKNVEVHKAAWAPEPALNDVIVHFVESGAWARAGEVADRLSASGNFPDLRRKFLWSTTGSVNASYNKVTVDNPQLDEGPAYTQSQLTTTSTDQIDVELKGTARADSRDHGWDNALLVQYATARVAVPDGGEQARFQETKDLVRARSAYKAQGLRASFGDPWWAPIPFAEAQLETEFDAPEDRAWHRLELTGIVGTSFRVANPLELKIGVNGRRDVNQPAGQTTWGLNAGWRQTRADLFKLLGKPVQLESELDWFFNSIGAEDIQELRGSGRLYFAFTDRLFFTSTLTTFLYRSRAVGRWGKNTQLSLGLNFLWDAWAQTY